MDIKPFRTIFDLCSFTKSLNRRCPFFFFFCILTIVVLLFLYFCSFILKFFFFLCVYLRDRFYTEWRFQWRDLIKKEKKKEKHKPVLISWHVTLSRYTKGTKRAVCGCIILWDICRGSFRYRVSVFFFYFYRSRLAPRTYIDI